MCLLLRNRRSATHDTHMTTYDTLPATHATNSKVLYTAHMRL